MDYTAVKIIHVACVIGTYALFFTRGAWMIGESPLLGRRWVKIVPHAIDTLLLASGIAMAVVIGMYPFVNAWLTAKVLGLIAYIALGTIALKRGRSKGVRVAAWLAAQAVFFYIVAVALTKQVLPYWG